MNTLGLVLIRCMVLVSAVAVVFYYDRLIRRFRAKCPSEWEAAGRPRGFWLWERGTGPFTKFGTQVWFSLKTTFQRPAWTRDDEELASLWRKYVAWWAQGSLAIIGGAIIQFNS